jgi:hypothetical protein
MNAASPMCNFMLHYARLFYRKSLMPARLTNTHAQLCAFLYWRRIMNGASCIYNLSEIMNVPLLETHLINTNSLIELSNEIIFLF